MANDINRKIMSQLFDNPGITQTELSKYFKVSQPAISSRLNEMKKNGLINNTYGIDFKECKNFYLAKVEVACKNTELLLPLLEKCPYCINTILLAGKYNLCLHIASEDITTIDSFVELHLRANSNVSDVNMALVISSARNLIFPVKICIEKKETNLCGKYCEDCYHYKTQRCLGCPGSLAYRGKIL